MGLFRKKNDPIKDREKNLVSEIRQLEDQIRELQGVLETAKDEEPQTPPPAEPDHSGQTRPPREPAKVQPAEPARPRQELVFETVNQKPLQNAAANPFQERRDPRALQREGSTSFLERLMRYFRGPTSNNPKLVSYLAAGNIHGLQPLRYERRVARNRLLLWIAIIVVLIVGMLKMLLP